jgi:hypothetical protein
VARRSPEPKPKRTPEEQAELRRLADGGDVVALTELTALPHDTDDLWIEDGDLGARADRALMQLATTTEREEAELARYATRMRRDLDGPAPSPTERVLVDSVVTCWLHVTYLQGRWAHALKDGSAPGLKDVDYLLNGAQRRYLEAHKTLAQVRRLIVPVVQFNVAKHQVNVVGGSALGELGSSS